MTNPSFVPEVIPQRVNHDGRARILASVASVVIVVAPTAFIVHDLAEGASAKVPAAVAAETNASDSYKKYFDTLPQTCQVILEAGRNHSSMAEWAAAVQTSGACGAQGADVVVKYNDLTEKVASTHQNRKYAESNPANIEGFGALVAVILSLGGAAGSYALVKNRQLSKTKGNDIKSNNSLNESNITPAISSVRSEVASELVEDQPTLPLENPKGYEPTDDELVALAIANISPEAQQPQFPPYVAPKSPQR